MPTTSTPPPSQEGACQDASVEPEEAEEEITPPAGYASPPCYLAEFADFDADSVVAD